MKNNGFILLEILLSLAIIGSVFVVSIQSFSYFIKLAQSSKDNCIAAYTAQGLISEVYRGKAAQQEDITQNTGFKCETAKTTSSAILSDYNIKIKWLEQGVEKCFEVNISKCEPKGSS